MHTSPMILRHYLLNQILLSKCSLSWNRVGGTVGKVVIDHILCFGSISQLIMNGQFCRCNGSRGWFPSNYVQVIKESTEDEVMDDQEVIENHPIVLPLNSPAFFLYLGLGVATTMET